MKHCMFALLLIVCQTTQAAEFLPPAADMPRIAREAIASYKEENRTRYLNTLFRLKMVAQDYTGARATLDELRQSMAKTDPQGGPLAFVQYETYIVAKQLQSSNGIPFDSAYSQAFREVFAKLDDAAALRVAPTFVYDLERARKDLQALAAKGEKGEKAEQADLVALTRAYQGYEVFSSIAALKQALLDADDQRRYLIDNEVLIKGSDSASLSARLVRKRGAPATQPTALIYNIYPNDQQELEWAKNAALHGYAGVVADARGKRLSRDRIVPYETETRDTHSVLDWIIQQPWSDGQVGMYGNSYSGFAAWAATKKPHRALKTIVPYAAGIPGQGLPMENNIFLLANYAWPFYVGNNRLLDDLTYGDSARWNSLNDKWFASGRAFREVDQVDGMPNPMLQRWLRHPSYDRYWQAMVPYQQDFSQIKIPVLSITGYYDDAQLSAVQYMTEHMKYNPKAEHYLVIGPWDHFGNGGTIKAAVVNEYQVDPVVQFSTPELTFAWMDYVMKGAPLPAMLKDRVNFEVMGANTWRHAKSIESMSDDQLVLYLDDANELSDVSGVTGVKGVNQAKYHQLTPTRPHKGAALIQTVDLAERKTSHNDYYPYPAIGKQIDPAAGLSFISAPFEQAVSINGMLHGMLKASINKRDMDFGLVLYELMPDGRLFHLSYHIGRASYARDSSKRHLLTPGKLVSLPLERTRMVSRQLSKGSRLLLVLDINKNAFAQVNYGSGKDVSDENARDAGTPLKVKWHADSYITVPITRASCCLSP